MERRPIQVILNVTQYVLKMKVMESSAGPGQRNKGTDSRVGYLYKLPPSGDLSAIINDLQI